MAWKANLLAAVLLFAWPAAGSAQDGPPDSPLSQADIDPRAITALQKSAAFLRHQPSFALSAEMTIDTIDDDDHPTREMHQIRYEYRAPDGLFVDWRTGGESRQLYFNGGTMTLYMPATGYYLDLPEDGPPGDMLMDAAEDLGIVLPLPDPFIWTVSSEPPFDVEEAFYAGRERIGDTDTDHYFFRQEEIDWQIWIERGPHPLPRKIVITARDAPEDSRFTALLNWTLSPHLAVNRFVFTPPAGAHAIEPEPPDTSDIAMGGTAPAVRGG